MKKYLSIVVFALLISIFAFVLTSRQQTSILPQNISSLESTKPTPPTFADFQASFAIFTNGTIRVFTAAMYHNLSSDVYIEASNPNRIMVKKHGTTWNDFFSTLPFTLTPECLTTGTKETFCTGSKGTLKFYINGEQSSNAFAQEIRPGDSLLISYGSESEAQIQQQIERAR